MAKKIVIFSTKGGVGKTLIATNLAVCLGEYEAKRTCLIDLDTHVVGDMSRMLNIRPEKSLADMMHMMKEHPKQFKKGDFLVKSKNLNIDFANGVLSPQQSPHLEAARIKEVFDLIDKDYDYIVVDAGRSFSEVFVATLNQANLILLVVTPDILSVYQTKWALDTLQSLHFPLAMIRMILNRAESASSISWQEVRFSLPIDIITRIPSDGKAVGQAVNRGVPVVVEMPRAKITYALKSFSHELVANDKMFIEHKELDQIKFKQVGVEKTGDFWQRQGLTENLEEPDIIDESDEILMLKQRIHTRLIDGLNLKHVDPRTFSDINRKKALQERAAGLIANFLVDEASSFISSMEVRKKLVKEILDEALGLGPLEDLLADPEITDIMVNNKDEVYVERNGKIELTSKKFLSNEQVKTIIERIIAPLGRRIDESSPLVDARLPDGSRVNAIIPPLSLTGPSLTVRKFRKERFTMEELIEFNTLNQEMFEFIKACVLSRRNIIISGGTGSGKTTILNVLSGFIPNEERIVTIEDAAELKLHQDHWVRLESRPPNIEGKGAITIRDLFRNTLRMRPDRVIIGECRGVETLDMLQAMNTGHDGSMTTVHANSTHDVLVRLDSMILMSGIELPMRAIREMIASTIHLIIHTARLSDGSRKVVQITEAAGMRDDLHIELKDIFKFKQTGVDKEAKVLGSFQATGYIPSFIDEIKIRGISLAEGIFAPPK